MCDSYVITISLLILLLIKFNNEVKKEKKKIVSAWNFVFYVFYPEYQSRFFIDSC